MAIIDINCDIQESSTLSPRSIIIYAKPKKGKSTICAHLSRVSNGFIIDAEDSYVALDARKFTIQQHVSNNALKWREFLNVLDTLKEKGKQADGTYKPFFKFLIVDSLTRIDEWSETVGTYYFMNKSQGKSWNVKLDSKTNQPILDANKKPIKLTPEDKTWESVHEMGQGFGYRYSREAMIEIYEKMLLVAEKIVFICHVKDKFLKSESDIDTYSKEINLTGKVKDFYTQNVDAVALLEREEDKAYLKFTDDEGSRFDYLSNKSILISEKVNGRIVTHWDSIFPDIKFN
jgi:hypothetical protein